MALCHQIPKIRTKVFLAFVFPMTLGTANEPEVQIHHIL